MDFSCHIYKSTLKIFFNVLNLESEVRNLHKTKIISLMKALAKQSALYLLKVNPIFGGSLNRDMSSSFKSRKNCMYHFF